MPQTAHAPLRLPESLREHLRRAPESTGSMRRLLRDQSLSTVCEEARCPNLRECFSSGTATFMIAGDRCTRRCHFCSVTTAKPRPLDPDEPGRLADAAAALKLRHVVITSVDRDDQKDGGAHHWAACIRAVKARLPAATVEILTPDFKGDTGLLDVVLAACPDVFNHNTETVARLYQEVRPQSRYDVTQGVLRYVASTGHPAVKSGIMVGLGETDDEVLQTLTAMRGQGVHIATIGQYLRPSLKHWPVHRYVDDASYARFVAHGEALGFTHVFAGPFVRSSYHAGESLRAHASSSAATTSQPSSQPPRRGLVVLP